MPAAPSIIRTLVPLLVGQIVAFFLSIGLTVSEDQEAAFTTVLGFLVTAVYYLLIRFLEQKFPWIGVLLGWAATPDGYSFGDGHDVVESSVVGEEAFFDDQDEVVDEDTPEELDQLEEHKADEQLALDEQLADETPVPDGYEPRH